MVAVRCVIIWSLVCAATVGESICLCVVTPLYAGRVENDREVVRGYSVVMGHW